MGGCTGSIFHACVSHLLLAELSAYRRPTEISKHVFKKDILYAYSGEANRGN